MTRWPLLLLACALGCQSTPEPVRAAPPPRYPGVDVATDITYITRHLLGLPPVPQSYRDADPTIPSDEYIISRITRCETMRFDVDGDGSVNVATDLVYIARQVLGLPPVPASFRAADPGIPPDDVIGAAVDALCPD